MCILALLLAGLAQAAEPAESPYTRRRGASDDAIDQASQRAPLAPRRARVGVQLIGVPAGLGLRAHLPVGGSVELAVGASGAVGWFASPAAPTGVDARSAPYRVRADLGVDKVLVEADTRRLFVGVQAAAAYWTRTPTLGGTNLGFGPHIGMEQGMQAFDLIVRAGLLAHQYQPGHYRSPDLLGRGGGDSAQVLPQVDLEVLF